MNQAQRWKAFLEWWYSVDRHSCEPFEVLYDRVQAKIDELRDGGK